MDKTVFKSIKIGERVGFTYRTGEHPGANIGYVIAKVEDKWGCHVHIKRDGVSRDIVEEFVEHGVGCYRLDRLGE